MTSALLADKIWNPVTGCLHQCENCRSCGLAEKYQGADAYFLEAHSENEGSAIKDLKLPFRKGSLNVAPFPYGFAPTLHRYRLNIPSTLWTQPATIAVCVMGDLFGEWVPDEWIQAVFDASKEAPWHQYLFLTKNPARYIALNEKGVLPIFNNWKYFIIDDRCEWFKVEVKWRIEYGKPFKYSRLAN